MKQKTFQYILIFMAACVLLTLLGIAFAYVMKSNKSCPIQVCPMSSNKTIIVKNNEAAAAATATAQSADIRDRRVINDPLYPALNRTDATTFNNVSEQVKQGNLYQNTNDNMDSFRLVGYLSSTEPVRDAGSNNWKLFARMKDRQQGEYYIIPANNNIDLKIPLTSDIVVSERLRDVYTLPKEMQFNSPMLNHGVYQYTEIPKGDFGSQRYI